MDTSVKDTILHLCLSNTEALVFFDIGACEGESSLDYKEQFSIAHIHAFEPLPDNMRLIESNILKSGFHGIYPNEVCLSDSIGTAEFFVSSGSPDNENLRDYTALDYWNKSSSLLSPGSIDKHYKWLKFNESIKVKTITLDSYCEEKGIDHIDFVHMDVQGAELMVLNGAKALISSIDIIWLEVSSVDIYKNQPLKKEVNQYMKRHGFKKILDIGNHITGDELWMKSTFYEQLPSKVKGSIRPLMWRNKLNHAISYSLSALRSMLSSVLRKS